LLLFPGIFGVNKKDHKGLLAIVIPHGKDL